MTDKYVKRNFSAKGEKYLQFFPVLVIVGARQCGKTVLSRRLRPEWSYFDLEKSSDYDLITSDYELFFREFPEHIIIDEAQQDPTLFKELRGVIDRNREQKNRFILTGSSSPELLGNIAETLAGRAAIIELGTLSLNEHCELPLSPFYDIFMARIDPGVPDKLKSLKLRHSHSAIMSHFLKGGYPEPALHEDPSFHSMWMEQYNRSYIERDIRRLFPRLDIIRYRRFTGMLSSANGTVINRSELGRSLNVSEVTIKDYLDIAEGTFLWRNIFSYEKSVSRSVIKKPKGHFRDSGLGLWLQRIKDSAQLLEYPGVGSCFEAFVTEELIKGFSATALSAPVYYYYRTKNGAEVDLIVCGDFGVLPIEIKFGSHVKPGAMRWLQAFLKNNNLPLGLIINNSDRIVQLSDTIIQLPVSVL